MKKSMIATIASCIVFLPATLMAASFADMVFVVDQSGSMQNEFKWISSSLRQIDSVVQAKGITANYGIAGYEMSAGFETGFFGERNAWSDVPSDIDAVIAEADWAAENVYGGIELSYHAVDWAADNFTWSGGDFAKVMVLVTDEDVDFANAYSYNGKQGEMALKDKMADNDILLNVITYSCLFSLWNDAAFSKGDYIGLFDLDFLKSNPSDFTAEFTYAKINEIIEHDPVEATPTPEPGTLFLLGSGLVGIGGFARKHKKTGQKTLS